MEDFSRLSANWYQWAPGMGGGNISVSANCDDCAILFSTDDYSVHLPSRSGLVGSGYGQRPWAAT